MTVHTRTSLFLTVEFRPVTVERPEPSRPFIGKLDINHTVTVFGAIQRVAVAAVKTIRMRSGRSILLRIPRISIGGMHEIKAAVYPVRPVTGRSPVAVPAAGGFSIDAET